MTTATPIQNAMIPNKVSTDSNGYDWLQFKYTDDDKDPWRWPKAVTYKNKTFMWMSWNSDRFTVNYKEINPNELAFPTKLK